MKGILLILAIFISLSANGQGLLTVDKTEIKIGDQIKATIKINPGAGREWINKDSIWPDSVKGIEVVKGPETTKDNQNATLATWTISFFDTGWVRIPSLPITISQQGHIDTIYTNDIPIKVLAVEPDSTGLLAIKDIYKQPFSIGYYKRYLPHLAIVLLLLTGFILLLKKHRTKKVIPEIIPPEPLPHEWALNALDDLAEKRLWQSGEVKEHYSLLTAILREYLERRYGIHALEQTSDEILVQLHRLQLGSELLKDTEQLLSIADLIKFAKADPGVDIHAATIERVRLFIHETTSSIHPASVAMPKASGDEVVV